MKITFAILLLAGLATGCSSMNSTDSSDNMMNDSMESNHGMMSDDKMKSGDMMMDEHKMDEKMM